MTAQIEAIHGHSRGTYTGALRVHAELRAVGAWVGRKLVARLMRAAGLQSVSRHKWVTITYRDPAEQPAPDLVERAFVTSGQNRLWVADIAYLAVVLDVWSRREVSWVTATHPRTELLLEAFPWRATNDSRRPASSIPPRLSVHLDRVRPALPGGGCAPIDGSVDAYDNALCEGFFATPSNVHLLDRCRFATQAEARRADLQLHRGLVQSALFGPGLGVAHQL